jgi:hypothetical protein
VVDNMQARGCIATEPRGSGRVHLAALTINSAGVPTESAERCG